MAVICYLLPNPFTSTQPIVIKVRPIIPTSESFSLYIKTEMTIRPTPHHFAYPIFKFIRSRHFAKVYIGKPSMTAEKNRNGGNEFVNFFVFPLDKSE